MQKYLFCGIDANQKRYNMKRNFFYTSFLMILLAISSACKDKVSEDMDEWCQCMSHAKDDPQQEAECASIRDRIVNEYSYDPDATEIIRKKVDECHNAMRSE